MSTIFITLFIVLIVSASTTNAQCGPNEVWTSCGRIFSCQKNCADVINPNIPPCSADCFADCVCKPGFVRRTRRTRQCVLESECLR